MKTLGSVVGLALALAISFSVAHAADKEVTLKGNMCCAKCCLKKSDHCENVLAVKDGKKSVQYTLADNEVSKKFHEQVCKAPKKDVTVVGTVKEEGGKKIIEATKIE
jgi:hypothetical protein